MTRDWHLCLDKSPCYLCGEPSISQCDFIIRREPCELCNRYMCKQHSEIKNNQDMSDEDYCLDHRSPNLFLTYTT